MNNTRSITPAYGGTVAEGVFITTFVIFVLCVFVILLFSFTVESFLYIFTNIVPILLLCMEIHIYC